MILAIFDFLFSMAISAGHAGPGDGATPVWIFFYSFSRRHLREEKGDLGKGDVRGVWKITPYEIVIPNRKISQNPVFCQQDYHPDIILPFFPLC